MHRQIASIFDRVYLYHILNKKRTCISKMGELIIFSPIRIRNQNMHITQDMLLRRHDKQAKKLSQSMAIKGIGNIGKNVCLA